MALFKLQNRSLKASLFVWFWLEFMFFFTAWFGQTQINQPHTFSIAATASENVGFLY